MPRALWWSYGGGAVSYERGTPVRIRVWGFGFGVSSSGLLGSGVEFEASCWGTEGDRREHAPGQNPVGVLDLAELEPR